MDGNEENDDLAVDDIGSTSDIVGEEVKDFDGETSL